MDEKHLPGKRAIALLYDPKKAAAPQVVASGANLVAERIIATAAEAGVHIKEDPDLVQLLANIPVGDQIPVELYQTIAEVLAFVYTVNNRYKMNREGVEPEKNKGQTDPSSPRQNGSKKE